MIAFSRKKETKPNKIEKTKKNENIKKAKELNTKELASIGPFMKIKARKMNPKMKFLWNSIFLILSNIKMKYQIMKSNLMVMM